MAIESPRGAPGEANARLAPRWHTGALVALILAVAVTGSALPYLAAAGAHSAPASARSNGPHARIFAQYLPILIVNWALLAYCVRAFRDRNALAELIGERWRSTRRALVDLALSVACWIFITGVELAAAWLFPMGRNAAIGALLPSTEAERLTWAAVAVSVGFCEEIVYRGYLQTQLAAFTNSRAFGVLLQASLFGIAHLEQGPAAALRIALYGLALGALASFRRSLIPGILCHVGLDLASGLLR